jgi:hypothetical protein
MLNIPNTYSEWISCFDVLKDGTMDDAVLEVMNQGELSWQSGVAERITNYLFEVLSKRTEKINNMLQNRFLECNGTELEIANALVNARMSISNLMKLKDISAFPEELKNSIEKTLITYANTIQNSLLDSAKADITGKLKSIISNNPINRFSKDEIQPQNIKNQSNMIGLGKASGKRRIIIN